MCEERYDDTLKIHIIWVKKRELMIGTVYLLFTRFIERTCKVLKMYHMTLSAESHGFLDFIPPIPERYRHKLREHRLQNRLLQNQESNKRERQRQSISTLKTKLISALSRSPAAASFKKYHRE